MIQKGVISIDNQRIEPTDDNKFESYEPYGLWVFIERVKDKEEKVSGIIIPETAKSTVWRGKVIGAGKGERFYRHHKNITCRIYRNDGAIHPVDVKVDDEVLFVKEKASFDFIKHGKQYTIIDARHIDAILEED